MALNPGLYSVVGDQTGNADITEVIVTNNPVVTGQPATATIQLIFAKPLLDDRYTLSINSGITDPAGNQLEGTSNASNPGSPIFPSGNGAPGNFTGRFTIDSRPHIGIAGTGLEELDVNGNGFWDPINATDAVNDDLGFTFGANTDNIFSGNLALPGQTGSGFDELGAYGYVNGAYRWILNTFGVDGTPYSVVSGLQLNALPVAGPFNPNITNATGVVTDEIALFDGKGNWYIDYNHTDNVTASSMVIHTQLRGYPVVGDFDGNGNIDLATYQPDTNTWQFEMNALTPQATYVTYKWGFPSIQARPVAGDMNMDGITDIGLFVPQNLDPKVNPGANWYFLVSQNAPATGYVDAFQAPSFPYNPQPFTGGSTPQGTGDLFEQFGPGYYLPLVGHWDPPALPNTPSFQATPGGPDTDVSATALVTTVPNDGYTGLMARYSTNGNNGVWGGLVNNGTSYTAEIRTLVNGKWTTLAFVPVANGTADGVLGLEVVGTNVQLSLNGNVLLTAAQSSITTAGAIGTYATPGSYIEPAQATSITQALVALPFLDAFNEGGNQVLDGDWEEWAGSFRTQGSVAAAQGPLDVATVNSTGLPSIHASVDVTYVPAGGFAGLLGFYNENTGDAYRAGIAASKANKHGVITYTAQIWRTNGKHWTLLASKKIVGGTGTGTLTFITVNGAQELFVNGVMVLHTKDTKLTSGTAGVYATEGVTFANFAVAPVTVTSTSLPYSNALTTAAGTEWSDLAGGFTSTAAGLVGLGTSNSLVLNGILQQNAVVQAQIGALPSGGSAGLLARTNAATGDTYWGGLVAHYNAKTNTTTYTAEIKRTIHGGTTVLWKSVENHGRAGPGGVHGDQQHAEPVHQRHADRFRAGFAAETSRHRWRLRQPGQPVQQLHGIVSGCRDWSVGGYMSCQSGREVPRHGPWRGARARPTAASRLRRRAMPC